jgi:predicted cupin superfamily sugar epimerase
MFFYLLAREALVLHYHRVQSSHTWGFSFSIAIAIYHAKGILEISLIFG